MKIAVKRPSVRRPKAPAAAGKQPKVAVPGKRVKAAAHSPKAMAKHFRKFV